jgi:hypothetical protein
MKYSVINSKSDPEDKDLDDGRITLLLNPIVLWIAGE